MRDRVKTYTQEPKSPLGDLVINLRYTRYLRVTHSALFGDLSTLFADEVSVKNREVNLYPEFLPVTMTDRWRVTEYREATANVSDAPHTSRLKRYCP